MLSATSIYQRLRGEFIECRAQEVDIAALVDGALAGVVGLLELFSFLLEVQLTLDGLPGSACLRTCDGLPSLARNDCVDCRGTFLGKRFLLLSSEKILGLVDSRVALRA